MALSETDKQKLTAQQQAEIQSLTNKWNEVEAQYKKAQASGNTALANQLNQQKSDLHTQAEAIRSNAGYSGGSDGSQNVATNKGSNGYQSLNSKVYAPLNSSIAAATPVKDQYGNSVRTASKEAVDATQALKAEQVQNQVDYINKNPDAVKSFGSGEFMDLYGNVMTTAPNGTQVAIKDLVNVGPTATYTYNADKANAAKAQGYTVVESEYLGKPAWRIEGVKRTTPEGTSGADESLLSDTAYAALLYERQQYNTAQAAYQAAQKSGDTAAMAAAQQAMDAAHLNAERLRSNTWLGGYSGGADGSMYIDYKMEAAKGTMPAYSESTQRFLDAKGMDYTLPSWQQEAEEGEKPAASTPSHSSGSNAGSLPSTSAPSLGGTTGGGSVGTGNFTVNDYSQYLNDMYKAKQQAAIAALEAAYQQNLNSINRAGVGLAEAYQNARNQTAGASELAKRNFAQYAAASGLNTGAAGQAELARNVALMGNLNTINTQEAQSVADLELQKADAEVSYNNAIAQAEASGNYELANALYQEKVRYETAVNEAIQQQWQNALAQYQLQYQAYRDSVADSQWERQFENSLAQQNWQNAYYEQQYQDSMTQQNWENAMALQQYQNALAQQQYENLFNQAKYNNSLKEDSGTDEKSKMSLSDAKALFEDGVFTAEALQAFYDAGWSDSAIYSKYGYNPSAAREQEELAATIPDNIRNMLMTNFPGGFITGANRWQSWVDKYGEDALKAAGFAYGGSGTHENLTSIRNNAKSLWADTKDGGVVADYLNARVNAGQITEQEAESIAKEILSGG